MTEETPDLVAVTDSEARAEEKAGVYLMVQFEDTHSIRYQRVMSKPEPSPLAVIAALEDIVWRLKTALAFQQEVQMAAAYEQAQAAAQQQVANGLKCPNCQAPLTPDVASKVLSGKVAFCARCHQKVG